MTHPRLLVHTSVQAMRWGDMDAMGHINNTVYFRYMEQARIEWLFAKVLLGGGDGQGPVIVNAGCNFLLPLVIVNASCNFLLPLVYPGDVEVRMYLTSPGRSSVGSYYDIVANGKKCADGTAKIVWIDIETGRPMPLPESITAPLRGLEA